MAKNVLGNSLILCSKNPLTGFYRNGKCDTCKDDIGMHTVCALMTDDFLKFSYENGNDLSTPRPEYNFPGLNEGDYWCLCLSRWIQAYNANCAPKVKLDATHASVLEFVELSKLKEFEVN
ncbi:MAG: DUF2237 domain-containing protein [Verrucomicrobiota bacterium]|nr:DUF2237 domain-containing protein [Verrucomicrobiota bacterium]